MNRKQIKSEVKSLYLKGVRPSVIITMVNDVSLKQIYGWISQEQWKAQAKSTARYAYNMYYEGIHLNKVARCLNSSRGQVEEWIIALSVIPLGRPLPSVYKKPEEVESEVFSVFRQWDGKPTPKQKDLGPLIGTLLAFQAGKQLKQQDIVKATGQSKATVSRHCRKLYLDDMLTKAGDWYKITEKGLAAL